MMQLLCNGIRLDLNSDTNIQLTHENPLFAFDNLKCERTTQFKLPRTSTNDEAFALARIPAYDGLKMRRKLTAQLVAGVIVMDGYLYISSWDSSSYNAIFVTGQLLGLQSIKDAGKLTDIKSFNDVIQSPYTPKASNSLYFQTELFDAFQYFGEDGTVMLPSINVGLLIDALCTELNVACDTPSVAYDMRLAVPALLPPGEVKDAVMHSDRTEDDPYNTIYPDELQRLVVASNTRNIVRKVVYHRNYDSPMGEELYTDTDSINVSCWRSPNNITLKFPDDLDYDYFLLGGWDADGNATFLGDYSFTKTVTSMGEGTLVISGDPLAGRSVEVPANTDFVLAKFSDYIAKAANVIVQIDDEPVLATAVTRGWYFTNGLDYDITVGISTDEENVSLYRLQDNLPDCTLTDLLKFLAAEIGKQLYYTEEDGISFDDLDLTSWNTISISDKVTKKGEVKRTFMKFGQNSYVKYKEDDAFFTNEQANGQYTIDNKNLDDEYTIMTLGWTNGGFYANSQGVIAYDREGRKEFLELRMNSAGFFALRAYIETNSTIETLCDKSTQVVVECSMNLLQYQQITDHTIILLDGSQYVWTSRNWQKGIAKFTLAKIS